jgi:hypothetical protein
LVEASHTSTFHAGGLPLSPGGVIFSALGSLQNMSDQQLARAIDDLGLNLAEKIPELPSRTGASLVGSARPGTRTVPQTDPHEEAGVTQGTDGANSMEASARSASTGPRGYRVQVASFRSLGDANRAVQVIFDKGYGQYSPLCKVVSQVRAGLAWLGTFRTWVKSLSGSWLRVCLTADSAPRSKAWPRDLNCCRVRVFDLSFRSCAASRRGRKWRTPS